MTDDLEAATKTIEEWLTRAEGDVTYVPSWIPSAYRDLASASAKALDLVTACAVASISPPSVGRLTGEPPRPNSIPAQLMALVPSYVDVCEENAALQKQVADMAISMVRLRAGVLASSEGELVRLAVQIAERIAGEELRSDPGLVVAWAREGLEALGAREDIVIAVAPDLAAVLEASDWAAVVGPGVRVETDLSLGAFACEVRKRASVVDASLRARSDAMARELGVDAK
ncbi:MAG TPA: FliH/SctL family protein [Polyangiaceae bacterium]|jgi:hypothetical protein